MLWHYVFLFIFLSYLLAVFILTRLFIPFLGFTKSKIDKVPKEILKKIRDIEKKSKDKMHYLQNVYNFITTKYHGQKMTTLYTLPKAFESRISELWKREGFLHCHHINHILRVFLAKSKFFKDDDIELRHTFWFLHIHQYIRLRISSTKYIEIDPWAKHCNIPLGEIGWGFK